MTLASMLDAGGTTAAEVAGHVIGLSPAERWSECLALAAAHQRRWWELASAPSSATAGELLAGPTARFAGRNSLPLFSRFEKWFAHRDGTIFGCNRHALGPLIGPGYFMVRDDGSHRLEFDYARVPAQAPPGWPAIRANSGVLARPVYGDLLDKVVWVAPDVLVGAAYRHGAPLDSYFVLVRTAP